MGNNRRERIKIPSAAYIFLLVLFHEKSIVRNTPGGMLKSYTSVFLFRLRSFQSGTKEGVHFSTEALTIGLNGTRLNVLFTIAIILCQ